MSVQTNQYLVYGYMMPYKEATELLITKHGEEAVEWGHIFDKYSDSAFKSNFTEVNGCSLIVDGMSGEYIFFGKIFAKSEVYQSLPTMEIPKVTSKIKKNLEKEYLELFGVEPTVKPVGHIITHYR